MRAVSRTTAIGAAVAIQALLVVVAVAPRLSARLAGDEYLLRVAPLDPIDPFRGAYVALNYPGLMWQESFPSDRTRAVFVEQLHGRVYVPLVREGDVWRGDGMTATRPSDGPYIACDYDYRLRCGIESFFASQAEARSLERDLASGGAIARVRIDGRGNAIVVGIEPG